MLVDRARLDPIFTHIGVGSGQRWITGGMEQSAIDAAEVAITWTSLNAPLLRTVAGAKGRQSLFSQAQDLWIYTVDPHLPKFGPSMGASIALALFCRMTNQPSPGYQMGVSATLDLRGRLALQGRWVRRQGWSRPGSSPGVHGDFCG